MRYPELEVVAAISEIFGDMELSRTVFTADIFSAMVLGRTGGFSAVKLLNMFYFTRSNFEKLAKFFSNNREALHLGAF